MTRNVARSRALARAIRWPLPGLPPVTVEHPSPSTATLYALAMVRETIACAMAEHEISASYSVIDYSDTPY